LNGLGGTLRVLGAIYSSASLPVPTRPRPSVVRSSVITIVTTARAQSGTASASGNTLGVWLTFAAAIIAAGVAGLSIYFVRKTGRDTAKAAQALAEAAKTSAAATEESARAATKSAEAANKSSDAAKAAVVVNARSADAADLSAKAAQASAASSDRSAQIAAARAQEESLLNRYRSASEQLDHRHSATVRLAGVYALAHLADDWPEQRQMCIDVLCAYLRMPWPGEQAAAGELQVRTSIVRLIDAHVTHLKRHRVRDEISWSGMFFDFSGGRFQDLRMEVPVFNNRVSFAGAAFVGRCQIMSPTFEQEVDFSDSTIEGRLSMERMTLGSNFMANRFHVLPQSSLTIAQSWVTGPHCQILIDGPVTEGNFEVSVHSHNGNITVHIDELEVKPGSRVVIKSHSNDPTADAQWLHTTGWMVHPKATVWLPAHAARQDIPWLKTSVARSASVKFGDPPPLSS
jgi:hypothetical protein